MEQWPEYAQSELQNRQCIVLWEVLSHLLGHLHLFNNFVIVIFPIIIVNNFCLKIIATKYCDIFYFSIGKIIAIIDKYLYIIVEKLIKKSQRSGVLKVIKFSTMHCILDFSLFVLAGVSKRLYTNLGYLRRARQDV